MYKHTILNHLRIQNEKNQEINHGISKSQFGIIVPNLHKNNEKVLKKSFFNKNPFCEIVPPKISPIASTEQT